MGSTANHVEGALQHGVQAMPAHFCPQGAQSSGTGCGKCRKCQNSKAVCIQWLGRHRPACRKLSEMPKFTSEATAVHARSGKAERRLRPAGACGTNRQTTMTSY
jgi:hypothetical protein